MLRGENPGELPVEQPITFKPTVSPASPLGIAVPPSLSQRADGVIE